MEWPPTPGSFMADASRPEIQIPGDCGRDVFWERIPSRSD
jgi:hypothetical protein